jgi:predicted RNase H-like nuclease
VPGARRGPDLPYKLLASVLPLAHGWLVATARLQGITAFPVTPEVYDTFVDVLDARPAFDVIALHLPLGLPSERTPGGRTCDREARKLVGFTRGGALFSPPTREQLSDFKAGRPVEASPIVQFLLPRIVEVYEEIAPYRQRTVFEVHSETSYYQLNDDQPLRFGKHLEAGREERRELLERRMQGIDAVIDAELPRVGRHHLLDAAVGLWTARRIISRAATRLPEDPEWDEDGLRMEILR